MTTLISILIPLFNEEECIGAVLDRISAAPLPEGCQAEMIVVDDGSTDGSRGAVEERASGCPERIRLFRHDRERGRGAAIRTAVAKARGEFCLIQDANLNQDPRDYPELLRPLLEGEADAVYGAGNGTARGRSAGTATGYKAFRTAVLAGTPLRSDGFGFDEEIASKLRRKGARVVEAALSYSSSIPTRHPLAIWWTKLRFSFTGDLYKDPGAQTLYALSAAPRFNRWMADTIRPFVGRRVLEIGAGIGNLTSALVAGRERYAATDVDGEHLARLKSRLSGHPNLETRFCDLTRAADFEPFRNAMDTVICLNVLEHIDDDHMGLANIFSALAPGGRAIVLVPEGQSVYGTIDEALGHFRRYSEAELAGKIQQVGFQVERIIRFNRVSRPAWFVSGRILKRRSLELNQMRIYDRFVWLWRRIDGWLPWKPTSIIAIARRA